MEGEQMSRESFKLALIKAALTGQEIRLPGNENKYALENCHHSYGQALVGKKIYFLGSSITYGAASNGVAFPDYLAKEAGVLSVKEAISGTTLADKKVSFDWLKNNPEKEEQLINFMTGGQREKNGLSYLSRLKYLPAEAPDIFVCQLSTNDARHGLAVGEISASFELVDFDTQTTLGALEYLCAYNKIKWQSKLVFYTCLRDDEEYQELIRLLRQLQAKWHFRIIDLANNQYVQTKTKNHPEYMADDAHPTMAGYHKLWTPVFYRALAQI